MPRQPHGLANSGFAIWESWPPSSAAEESAFQRPAQAAETEHQEQQRADQQRDRWNQTQLRQLRHQLERKREQHREQDVGDGAPRVVWQQRSAGQSSQFTTAGLEPGRRLARLSEHKGAAHRRAVRRASDQAGEEHAEQERSMFEGDCLAMRQRERQVQDRVGHSQKVLDLIANTTQIVRVGCARPRPAARIAGSCSAERIRGNHSMEAPQLLKSRMSM